MIQRIHDFKSFQLKQKICLAIGNFDGVHLGHQEILNQCQSSARKLDLQAYVMTFRPHPSEILSKGQNPVSLIMSHSEKEDLLQAMGFHVLSVEFTQEFSQTQPKEFLRLLIENFNVQSVSVGYDFRYGKGGTGDTKLLREIINDRPVQIVERIESPDGNRISSSGLRKALKEGDLKLFKKWTNRDFFVQDKVVTGDGRGRKIGIPTANLNVSRCILQDGVYALRVEMQDSLYWAIGNLGPAPTFGVDQRKLEFHLLDENVNCYENTVKVEFLEYIRPVVRFENAQELKEQIKKDMLVMNKYTEPGLNSNES